MEVPEKLVPKDCSEECLLSDEELKFFHFIPSH
jgi:hypothetical protein